MDEDKLLERLAELLTALYVTCNTDAASNAAFDEAFSIVNKLQGG